MYGMKILFVTQKVDRDDDVLGYVHAWIERLAEKVDRLTVICLYQGSVSLPDHVRIYSLGKENNVSRAHYLIRFYRLIFQLRRDYDVVFVHMNQVYVLLGGIFWRLWRKRIVLWKTHYKASLSVRLATLLVHRVVSAMPLSFQGSAQKLIAIGHGIDTDLFQRHKNDRSDHRDFRLVFTGRISPVKRLKTLIEAMHLLKKKGVFFTLDIYGRPGSSRDEEYFCMLTDMVRDYHLDDQIVFSGWKSNREMPAVYQKYDVLINLTPSGSFDKAILEAMAMERLVLVCNTIYRDIFNADYQHLMMFKEGDVNDLSQTLERLMELKKEERVFMGKQLRDIVVRNHSLDRFIEKLVDVFEQ